MSRGALEDFRTTLAAISGRARADVESWFRTLDVRDASTVSRIMQEVLPQVVAAYGDAAALAALDYFESVREASAGARTSYVPNLSKPLPLVQTQASTRWAVGPLFEGDKANPAAALGRLMQATDRLTKAPARDTFAAAIEGDPDNPRFARIPKGRTTCRFCATLASRGAVYRTAETAGALTDFHDLCDCAVQPIYEGDRLPAGYDPDHYLQLYKDLGGADIDLSVRDFGALDTAKGATASSH